MTSLVSVLGRGRGRGRGILSDRESSIDVKNEGKENFVPQHTKEFRGALGGHKKPTWREPD